MNDDGSRPPVICIHGALRGRLGMWPTAQYFARRGHPARTFGYATRRGAIGEHAVRLAEFVADWLGPEPPQVVGFLTHSMGGLIVRAFLGQAANGTLGPHQRVVMLSPPNRGSALARKIRDRALFKLLYGEAGQELAGDAVRRLPPLPRTADVLILAGGTGGEGYNPMIDGDDDGVVAVDEMGLPGVEPTFVGGPHALLQWTPRLLYRAAEFICTGRDPDATPR